MKCEEKVRLALRCNVIARRSFSWTTAAQQVRTARTHGPGWRTAHASSIDEPKGNFRLASCGCYWYICFLGPIFTFFHRCSSPGFFLFLIIFYVQGQASASQCFAIFHEFHTPKESLHEGLFGGWSGWCVDLSQMMEFEEAMLHKEIRVQRLTENLEPAGAISEIRMLVQELKNQVLKLYQESSQKDQLLSDANFKLHMLSTTLTQKKLQLGFCDSFCDSLALEQADRPCS